MQAMCLTASFVLATAPSQRLTFRRRVKAQAKARPPRISTQQIRLQESTVTPTMYSTASCALPTALSPRSTLREGAQALVRAQAPEMFHASTRWGQFREALQTRTM